jgi:HlyD family secretion protein
MKLPRTDLPRRRWQLLAVAAALVAAGLAARAALGPSVPAYRVERRDVVQRVVASGRVLPPARVSLGSLSLAQVQRVLVDEGDRVKGGQLLLQLEDDEAQAALAQGRAAVAQAQRFADRCDRIVELVDGRVVSDRPHAAGSGMTPGEGRS